MAEIHLNDIGTIFEVTLSDESAVVIDISGATTREIVFVPPSDSVNKKTKAAALTGDGTDGKMQYTTVAGDIDEQGAWQLQAHVVLPSGEWRSTVADFNVFPNL